MEPFDWTHVDLTIYKQSEEEAFRKLYPVLCWPEVLNISCEIFPACTNDKRREKVNLIPGEKIATCIHCSKTMRTDKCVCVFLCIFEFEGIELQLPLEVLNRFFQEDVPSEYKENKKAFEKNCCSSKTLIILIQRKTSSQKWLRMSKLTEPC